MGFCDGGEMGKLGAGPLCVYGAQARRHDQRALPRQLAASSVAYVSKDIKKRFRTSRAHGLRCKYETNDGGRCCRITDGLDVACWSNYL